MSVSTNPSLWYRDRDSLRIGGVSRYTVEYTRIDPSISHIYLRLKNVEKTTIRAIHLLNGPFILYCHVIPVNYNYRKPFHPDNAAENSEVVFENQIKPNQSFNVTLLLNGNSLKGTDYDDHDIFQWEIEVISQIVITTKTEVVYDLMIGDDLQYLKKLTNRNVVLQTLNSFGSNGNKTHHYVKNMDIEDDSSSIDHVYNPQLLVKKLTADDLWSNEPKYPEKPVHLIIVTHGIFSNLTADMLYLKDMLELKVKDNILVRGYKYNAGRTEKGVKKLGINVANYIVSLIEDGTYSFDRISFIGHSLGGLVQLYAIKYILVTMGVDYFDRVKIKPCNLINMASPLLGVLNEMNFLISWVLDIGTLGKTGRDLTLQNRFPAWSDLSIGDSKKRDSFKPVLETLPDDPLESFLGRFEQLVVYANAINDGIVPLRTAALLYLDYEALGDVSELKRCRHIDDHPELEEMNHPIKSNTTRENVYEIPEEDNQVVKDIEDATLTGNEQQSDEPVKKSSDSHQNQLSSDTGDNDHETSQKHKHKHKHRHHLTRRQKRYKNFTVKGTESSLFSDVLPEQNSLQEQTSATSQDSRSIIVPPRASAIESAINTIVGPVPSNLYLMTPDQRQHVIFHDKYYHFDTPPGGDASNKDLTLEWLSSLLLRYHSKWKLDKQKQIADKYHNWGWRKVLVNLPPDAHNNIVVRRRFANGYGWGVIDHLCDLFRTSDNKL